MSRPYRKRARAGWRSGKGAKDSSDAEERQYAKREIKQMIAEMDADYLAKHRGKRKHNRRAQLEYRITWYEEILAKGKSSFIDNYFRRSLAEYKKKLQVLIDKEDMKK